MSSPTRHALQLRGRASRALAVALVASLVALSGAVGSDASSSQTPRRGGTLVVGTRTSSEPACLNVLLDKCTAPMDLLGKVLLGANEVTPKGTYRPELAEAEIVAKRPFTLLYHIRPEARWSDGVPVSARDFVFTARAIRKYGSPYADPPPERTLRSIRAIGPKTVKVVLRAPFADWRELFDIVLPRHTLAGQDLTKVWLDAIDNPKTGNPIGDGPFLVGAWDRGTQLTFVRNPHYWGPHTAYLDRLVYRFLPIEDLAAALRSGEIDMIDPFPAQLQAAQLEFRLRPDPGIRVLTSTDGGYEQISIRIGGSHPALGKRLVRQALAYGIDRVAIARTLGKASLDNAAGLEPQDSVVFLANSPYYRPNWKGYRYRPGRARQLLEQAGCRPGSDGIFVCQGDRLSLNLRLVTGVDRRTRTAELVESELRRIGVEVIPEFVSLGAWLTQTLPNGDFDLALLSWIPNATTAGWADIFGCQGSSNVTRYCDRLITRDLLQATRILDDRRRVRLLNAIDVRLAKAVPLIPLFQDKGLSAFRASVQGVVPNGVGLWAWNAENWWLAR